MICPNKAGMPTIKFNISNFAAKTAVHNTATKEPVSFRNDFLQRTQNLKLSPKYKQPDENLWNIKSYLSPRQKKYHKDEHNFKSNVYDLQQIESDQKKSSYDQKVSKHVEMRGEALRRQSLRTLENQILIHKSEQPLQVRVKSELTALESTEPMMFNEMLARKQWKHIKRDPKGTASYNDLPEDKLKLMLHGTIVESDIKGCDRILAMMLKDDKVKDRKVNLQRSNREEKIINLHRRHQQVNALEQKCGVKVGKLKRFEPEREFNDSVFEDGKGKSYSLNDVRGIHLKFDSRVTRNDTTLRTEILATPKPDYLGKDFFQRHEFRGLLVSDNQNALGDKALDSIDLLNYSTVSQFPTLSTFQDSYNRKKKTESFYKTHRSFSTTHQTKNDTFATTQRHQSVQSSMLEEQVGMFESQWKHGHTPQPCRFSGATLQPSQFQKLEFTPSKQKV